MLRWKGGRRGSKDREAGDKEGEDGPLHTLYEAEAAEARKPDEQRASDTCTTDSGAAGVCGLTVKAAAAAASAGAVHMSATAGKSGGIHVYWPHGKSLQEVHGKSTSPFLCS